MDEDTQDLTESDGDLDIVSSVGKKLDQQDYTNSKIF